MSGKLPTTIVAIAPPAADTAYTVRATRAHSAPRPGRNTVVITQTPTINSRNAVMSRTRERVRRWLSEACSMARAGSSEYVGLIAVWKSAATTPRTPLTAPTRTNPRSAAGEVVLSVVWVTTVGVLSCLSARGGGGGGWGKGCRSPARRSVWVGPDREGRAGRREAGSGGVR